MANMWNTLEEISRDISQIEPAPETEEMKVTIPHPIRKG